MTDVSAFLDAIDKLPAYGGFTFRGLDDAEALPPALGVAAGVLATSRDPRVASENFRTARVLALLNRTGRDISRFSAQPDEGEVVVRPGSVWRVLTSFEVAGTRPTFVVLEELDPSHTTPEPTEWGDTLAETRERLTRVIAEAATAVPVAVASPGKFVGPWPAQVPSGW